MPRTKPPRSCNSNSNFDSAVISAAAPLRIALAAWVLAGCTPTSGADTPAPAVEAGATALPARAIAIGGDVFMVPAGADDIGCPWFRAFSPTKMVVQAMFYRDAAGGFVMDRNEAVCAVE